MPVLTNTSFHDILGLGYSGYAIIDGFGLLLLPSTIGEQDNLMKSQAAIGPAIDLATGELVVRNRRSLHPHLTVEMTPTALALAFSAAITWRAANQFTQSHTAQITVANHEGYTIPELYFESIRLTVPEEGLATITFEGMAWRWLESPGTLPSPTGDVIPLFDSTIHQPLPGWACSIVHSGQAGVAKNFDIEFRNSWSFRQLLEGTAGPPTPRLVYPGPLLSTLTLTTLAERNSRPLESGHAVCQFGGVAVRNTLIPAQTMTFPFLYRDPHRTYESFGAQNTPIFWSVAWNTFGAVPVVT